MYPMTPLFNALYEPARQLNSFLSDARTHEYEYYKRQGKCGACLCNKKIAAVFPVISLSLCSSCTRMSDRMVPSSQGQLLESSGVQLHEIKLREAINIARRSHACIRIIMRINISWCDPIIKCSVCTNDAQVRYPMKGRMNYICFACNDIIAAHINDFYTRMMLVRVIMLPLKDAGKCVFKYICVSLWYELGKLDTPIKCIF